MKTLKTILVLSVLLATSISFAQRPGGGQRGGQQGPPPIPDSKEIFLMVSELSKELTLTEAQETKILELYNEHFDQMRKKLSGNQRPDRDEMEALKDEFEVQVNKVLTEEQQKLFKKFQKGKMKGQKQGERRPLQRR